jgi:hypothetical protein
MINATRQIMRQKTNSYPYFPGMAAVTTTLCVELDAQRDSIRDELQVCNVCWVCPQTRAVWWYAACNACFVSILHWLLSMHDWRKKGCLVYRHIYQCTCCSNLDCRDRASNPSDVTLHNNAQLAYTTRGAKLISNTAHLMCLLTTC